MKLSEKDFLSPEVVGRLARLDLVAKTVVEGYITGLHKSPYHGFSTEFAEHRQYMPGDAFRYVDWKVYGRTDRLYIKRFEEETNCKSHILLDVSGSMDFQHSGPVSKLRYATMLAAALSYLMLRQRDAAGLVTYAEKMQAYLPPRSVQSQLTEILKVLSHVEAEGATRTPGILHALAERLAVRGLVILISDLVFDGGDDEDADFLKGLKHFRHDGHEVLVFHVIDPAEKSFNFSGETRFVDLESGSEIATQPRLIREEYLARYNKRLSALVRAMHDISVEYVELKTDVPYDRALTEYLAKRKRLY